DALAIKSFKNLSFIPQSCPIAEYESIFIFLPILQYRSYSIDEIKRALSTKNVLLQQGKNSVIQTLVT
ncbi:MAG: hypothetical protein ACXVNF_01035, partial [Neobacillus sp.]